MNHPSVALTPAECLTLYLIAQGQSQPTVALLRGYHNAAPEREVWLKLSQDASAQLVELPPASQGGTAYR